METKGSGGRRNRWSGGGPDPLPCDAVIVAIGARSLAFADINSYCKEQGITCHVIGDAVRARRALNAVAEANEVARAI